MRRAGAIADEAAAKRFIDHLYTLEIAAMAEPTRDGPWDIWINEETDLARSKEELQAFLVDPNAEKYRAAPEEAKARARKVLLEKKKTESNLVELRSRTAAAASLERRPLTLLLIAICTFIALMTSFGEKLDSIDPYLFMTAIVRPSVERQQELERRLEIDPNLSEQQLQRIMQPYDDSLPEIRRGEIWRLVTPMLIHLSFYHLLFNMYWLYVLGGAVEQRYGSFWFGWFVIIAQVATSLVQYFWEGPMFGGFSGVNYALFGYVWMKSKYDPSSGLYVDKTTVFVMLLWFVVCFTGAVGPVANGGHTGGFIAGLALGYLPKLLKR